MMNEHLTKALHDLEFARESIIMAIKETTTEKDVFRLFAAGGAVNEAILKIKETIKVKGEG